MTGCEIDGRLRDGARWAADERLDYKGMVYIYKGEEVFLEVLEHARSLSDGITRPMSSF